MGQTSVDNTFQGSGVVGEFYANSPQRSRRLILNSDTESYNVVGSALTMVEDEDSEAGIAASTVFAGILGCPKTAVRQSLTSDDDDDYLSNDSDVEVIEQGYVFVTLTTAASIGDYVYYSDTDGTLLSLDPDTSMTDGYSRVPGGTVEIFNTSEAGTAVIFLDKAGDKTETA